MNILFLTKEYGVDPEDISAIEDYEHWENDPSPSGASYKDHSGVIIILKNGRKTYLKNLTASVVKDMLNQWTKDKCLK